MIKKRFAWIPVCNAFSPGYTWLNFYVEVHYLSMVFTEKHQPGIELKQQGNAMIKLQDKRAVDLVDRLFPKLKG